ncbi:uncharacterized protein LOC116093603 [Mastomys coucha]|uniref:uncharacterized protein LOC116093603 n=1 Tax=Mastomys coucha TaxID=35658 RepID=UPI0012621718|nr:uncharacterized protein LOC116093603 [Mastomys coucha]XP_031231007.1 uncharacterized protein LOC116093603 [Mastomys coucha]XP_031231008.1 uncharacterized protein LOC116093603 [Mastomys coucha]
MLLNAKPSLQWIFVSSNKVDQWIITELPGMLDQFTMAGQHILAQHDQAHSPTVNSTHPEVIKHEPPNNWDLCIPERLGCGNTHSTTKSALKSSSYLCKQSVEMLQTRVQDRHNFSFKSILGVVEMAHQAALMDEPDDLSLIPQDPHGKRLLHWDLRSPVFYLRASSLACSLHCTEESMETLVKKMRKDGERTGQEELKTACEGSCESKHGHQGREASRGRFWMQMWDPELGRERAESKSHHTKAGEGGI